MSPATGIMTPTQLTQRGASEPIIYPAMPCLPWHDRPALHQPRPSNPAVWDADAAGPAAKYHHRPQLPGDVSL